MNERVSRCLATLTDERLSEREEVQTPDGPRAFLWGEALRHVVNHGTYHRGQLATVHELAPPPEYLTPQQRAVRQRGLYRRQRLIVGSFHDGACDPRGRILTGQPVQIHGAAGGIAYRSKQLRRRRGPVKLRLHLRHE